MEKTDLILSDREKKNNYLSKYLHDYQVVTLKANIPGPNKNIKEAYVLINIMDKCLNKLNLFKQDSLFGLDGPMYIYLCNKSLDIKSKTIHLEEEHPLGRFVDIDVYNDSKVSLNRSHLRRCYLCGEPAFVCARLKKHSLEELINFLKEKINIFLSQTIYALCDDSMMQELKLHPKFGLVTPYTSGSHHDMNYELMVKAQNAIKEYFVEMFFTGYERNNLEEIFLEIRKIGLRAEDAMFQATNGINCYKGLIFDLGLIVSSIGYQLNNHDLSIYEIIKIMTKGILEELTSGTDTFGKVAYQNYHIGGARYEAESGFLNLRKALERFNFDQNDSLKALCYIISSTDDTVLLKRSKSIDKYHKVKNEFKNLLDNFNQKDLEILNNKCIKEELSFGGSADIFICCCFLKKISFVLTIN